MTKQPLYSVIIPHYNSPDLLMRCLASIPDREDIQVIVIDDNSSADVVDFTNFPGKERIYTTLLFNKDNQGAGHARNLGLERATGKWLIFADADDFFLPNAWNTFGKYAESDYDIIYFQYTSVNSETLQPDARQRTYGKYFDAYFANPNQYTLDHLRFRHDIPWGKMIRKSIVDNNHIVFGETKYCNDTLFSTKVALLSKSIAVEKEPVYCVTSSSNSLIHQVSETALLTRLDVLLTKNQLLRANHQTIHQISVLFYFRNAIQHYGFRTLCKAILLAYRHKTTLFMIYIYSRLYRN